jgi:hypothetical protein
MAHRLIATIVVLLAAQTLTRAQLPESTTSTPLPTLTATIDAAGNVVIGNTVLTPDTQSTQEELPGLGHKFELFGAMIRDTDPENPVGNSGGSGGGVGGNETISADTTDGALAFAYRNLPPGIKITALTNQIGLKYYFLAPRTCHGGSPRIVLLVDAYGDGTLVFAANGHVSPLTNFTLCPMNKWITEDLTDDLGRWEVTGASVMVTGIPPNAYLPWKAFSGTIALALPNHKVRAGFLLDGESCGFDPLGCGKAYYDLVTIENRTLEIWQDTVKN